LVTLAVIGTALSMLANTIPQQQSFELQSVLYRHLYTTKISEKTSIESSVSGTILWAY
jgi:hypothetical protein